MKYRGFTIVELLIAIVIISLLATITVVAYNGVQVRAKNSSIISQARQWQKILLLYKTEKGSYPLSSYSCLGNNQSNFPASGSFALGDCQILNGTASSYSETYLGSDIKGVLGTTMKQIPSGATDVINGTVAGVSISVRGFVYNNGPILQFYLYGKGANCYPGEVNTNFGVNANDTLTACRFSLT